MAKPDKTLLRRAELPDAPVLAHLMNMVSGGALAKKFSRDAAFNEGWLDVARREIGSLTRELSYVNCIVYELNGDVAGMVLLNWLSVDAPVLNLETIELEARPVNELVAQVPGSLLIRELGVFEKYRRRGIAEAFLDLAEGYARSKEILKLSLTVHETSVAALRLYERFGFTLRDMRIIEQHDAWAVGSKLYLMVKELG